MTFFTKEEFKQKYNEEIEDFKIEWACEMIYTQVGRRYRREWNIDNVPSVIKNASMEQLRFMLEHDIPFVDYKNKLKAGEMESELKSDYSTLALRMLGNHGYLNRANPINYNMTLEMEF